MLSISFHSQCLDSYPIEVLRCVHFQICCTKFIILPLFHLFPLILVRVFSTFLCKLSKLKKSISTQVILKRLSSDIYLNLNSSSIRTVECVFVISKDFISSTQYVILYFKAQLKHLFYIKMKTIFTVHMTCSFLDVSVILYMTYTKTITERADITFQI